MVLEKVGSTKGMQQSDYISMSLAYNNKKRRRIAEDFRLYVVKHSRSFGAAMTPGQVARNLGFSAQNTQSWVNNEVAAIDAANLRSLTCKGVVHVAEDCWAHALHAENRWAPTSMKQFDFSFGFLFAC